MRHAMRTIGGSLSRSGGCRNLGQLAKAHRAIDVHGRKRRWRPIFDFWAGIRHLKPDYGQHSAGWRFLQWDSQICANRTFNLASRVPTTSRRCGGCRLRKQTISYSAESSRKMNV